VTRTAEDPLVGKPAPQFCLPDADEKSICLADFSGRWVVVYFYPRDNTPGCTLEARGFSDAVDDFAGIGAVILGISGDSVDSHKKFAEKQNLRFPILSDTSHQVLKSYGVWKDKKGIGSLFSTERSTFLIDPEGTVAAGWRKVRVFGHVEEVRERLKELTVNT
jgi:peroxiredoxin Q/BCP